jgi:TRAP-type mannitol/chloroaromatic compound transport system substrate-binding protein
MKRREFLTKTATGAAVAGAAVSALPAPAIANNKKVWKLATTWPKNAPGVGINAQRFADYVTEMTDGSLTVKLFGAGEIVPPFEVLDAVQSGVVEMGHSTPYYWVGKNKAMNFFTGVPFGLTALEMGGWLRFGGGMALWEEAYAPFGVKPFYAGASGTQAGGWFNKEINTVDDLRGLKMRIAGLGGEVMRRLGVAVTLTPPGEIFTALQSGTVDAAEWVSPWLDIAFGLQKAAKYYYMPAFHEPGPSLEVIVNKDALAGLSKSEQAIIAAAADRTNVSTQADFLYHNVDVFSTMAQKYPDVHLRTVPEDVQKALWEATQGAIADITKDDAFVQKVADSYLGFNQKANDYTRWAELGIMEMRARVMK